jgi:hypothetical protein
MCPGGGATLSPACHKVSVRFDGKEATALWDCHRQQLIQWSNGVSDWFVQDRSVSKVHVVYMTHLDVGFTNTSRNICDLYFDTYFPRAWNTSAVLRQRGGVEQYQWTEFPWLIQEYLDGAVQCAHRPRTAEEVSLMEAAIGRDDIIWHGNALNNFLELEDASLFSYSLQMAKKLSAKYNKTHGSVAGKHTDVPGMSKSAIPILAAAGTLLNHCCTVCTLLNRCYTVCTLINHRYTVILAAGIKGYHIGYNGACKKPESVPAISRWRHSASTGPAPPSSPSSPSPPSEDVTEVLLMTEDNYGTTIRVPGSDTMLAFMYQIDNTGPPTAEEVLAFWAGLRLQYPRADLLVSSLDGYVADVLSEKATYEALPVITGEIGDSWLYGSPADPIKLATYREARRSLQEAVDAGAVAEDSPHYEAFMRRLLKGPPEHNWGWATSIPVPTIGSDPWDNAGFEATRKTKPGYAVLEQEWAEQRTYCFPVSSTGIGAGGNIGIGAGGNSSIGAGGSSDSHAKTPGGEVDGNTYADDYAAWRAYVDGDLLPRLSAVAKPLPPSQAGGWVDVGHRRTSASNLSFTCDQLAIKFDPSDGSIIGLTEMDSGFSWASAEKRLAQLRYQTFSTADFDRFNLEYNPGCGPPCGAFAKPGMKIGQTATHAPALVSLHRAATEQCSFLLTLTFDDALHRDAGTPESVEVNITIAAGTKVVHVELTARNKTATRLAEAMWLSVMPLPNTSPAEWAMDVLGSPVSPMEVLPNASRHIHAVWEGVTWTSSTSQKKLAIRTFDAALVSPSDIDHLLRYDGERQPSEFAGGMHFNLHNNLWGTAFPQYFGDDTKFRFQLAFQ